MRPRHPVSAMVLVLALGVAGCGNDDPAPVDPTSAAAATSTPPAPEPSAAPTEPALPDAATRPDKAGARAFITHYWDLINYAQVTGDVAGLDSASGPNCRACTVGRREIRDVYAAGGHITRGEYTPEVTKIRKLPLSSDPAPLVFEALLTVSNGPHDQVNADGTTRPFAAGTANYAAYLIWADDRWRLDVMEQA